MITIKDNKLIIELEHVMPEEFIKDIQQAIIYSIQNQSGKCDVKELQESNCSLLELLRQTKEL